MGHILIKARVVSLPLGTQNSLQFRPPRVKTQQGDVSLLGSPRAATAFYFKAIKKAKRDHWSSFLYSATHLIVWTAKRITVGH